MGVEGALRWMLWWSKDGEVRKVESVGLEVMGKKRGRGWSK